MANQLAPPHNGTSQVREHLQLLADSNIVGMMFAKADGTIVDGNDEFLRIVGYSREELEAGALTWMKITPPGWTETDQQISLRVRNTGSAPPFEKEYIRKDGSRVPVMIGIAALPESEWDRGAMCFVVDLSVRKQAQRERDRLMTERVAMLESAGDGIYGMDVNGQCTFINRAGARMLGYAPEECLGRNIHDLAHSKYPDGSAYPREDCPIFRAASSGQSAHVEKDVVWRKDGTPLAVEYSSQPVVVGGRVEGTVVSFKDIGEREKSEAVLRASEERFRRAFANAAAGMFIVDLEGRFLDVNLAFCRMSGYDRQELVGREVAAVTHPEDVEKSTLLAGKLRGGEMRDFVTVKRYRRKDGTILWARMSASLVGDPDGNPLQVVCIVEDITERLRVETELRRSEQRYRSIVENTHEGICMCDPERGVTYSNPRLATMLGFEANAELDCCKIHFEEDNEECRLHFERRRLGVSETFETRLRRKDGSTLWANSSASPLKDDDGKFAGALCMFADVTERKRLEEQLQQAQKMEAVGRLAGGIAHDFNNLLTVILGYSGILERKIAAGDPMNKSVIEIRKAGERAAALTQKLLAFSRKQVQRPRVLSLNDLIRDTEVMLLRLIGEDIELVTDLDDSVGNIKADPSQMEQVLMNLSINARDAMPKGGHLLIETSRQQLDSGAGALRSVPAGVYVELTVTDTGCGMDDLTKSRIFEPFFTTKEAGLGTGLGLSTVLGVVKQSGGSIAVYTEVNVGTSFKIYLPLVEETAAHLDSPQVAVSRAAGETILLVEDDPSIRALAADVLREHGYNVMEAASAEEALAAGEVLSSVDLLVTDVIMSGMNGQDLADRLIAAHPRTKVLYMSGYTENAMTRQGILDPGLNFLAKPFRPEELLNKASGVLAGKKTAAKILVVDDDAQVRSFLATLLEVDGFSVLQASNGKEAQARCRDTRIGLVITDLVMPEQEGLETILAIRKNWPKIPMIAISGAFGGAYLEFATKLGADAMFRKPFDAETILSEVRRLIRR
jgi:two-component system, cell cycle sensor histidine kinase and response regulator CckA